MDKGYDMLPVPALKSQGFFVFCWRDLLGVANFIFSFFFLDKEADTYFLNQTPLRNADSKVPQNERKVMIFSSKGAQTTLWIMKAEC